MKFAVIASGGKQYLVQKGQKLALEKLPTTGETVSFNEVLLIGEEHQAPRIGQPHIKGASVTSRVVRSYRGKKVTVLKYKPKVRYRKKYGHRQDHTEVEITEIQTGD